MNMEEIFKRLEEYCEANNIRGEKKKELENRLKELIEKAKVEPGEALGIVCAHSLSEPATQLTMRAYHLAGGAAIHMSLGLPRLIELFDQRKNIEFITTVYTRDGKEETAKRVASRIVETKLRDLITSISLDILNMRVEIKLDEKELSLHNLDNKDIKEKILKQVKGIEVEVSKDKLYVYSKKLNMREFRKLKDKLLNVHIKGIKGVKKTYITEIDGEWVVQLYGGNFQKILQIEEVDPYRTYTNDFEQLERVLGIEAARTLLINEIEDTLQKQGINVDRRYMGLIADLMCFFGKVLPANRYGLMKKKKSVLLRLNFEETIKELFKACVLGKREEFNTLMANLMVGQISPVGTGMVKLKWKV